METQTQRNPAPDAPRQYWRLLILALSGFVTSFGAHIVATNLPAYAETVGAGAFMIGVLIGVYDFAELFAKTTAGFIADRRGMKLTLLVGLIIFILGSLLFLVISPKLPLLVRFVQGLGAAALWTVSITLVGKYFAAEPGASLASPCQGVARPSITLRQVSNTRCVRDSSSKRAINFQWRVTPGLKFSASSGAYLSALDYCTEVD